MAVELYDINADFHESLARCSGNRYSQHSFVNYRWDYGAERVQSSINEHLGILSALEQGEHQVASVLMRRHLESASAARHDKERGGGANRWNTRALRGKVRP